jgi:hypothetical protein
MTYVEQFNEYIIEQKKKGLLYLRVIGNPEGNFDGITQESFCKEFMEMVNSPDLPDEEVLGKHGFF